MRDTMLWKVWIASLATVLIAATHAEAQRRENGSDMCDSALLPQITVASSSVQERVAWLSLVTESNYEQGRAGGAVNLILEDLPIGASYQQFDEKRRDYFALNRLHYDRAEARAVFRQSLFPEQLIAWTTCMTSDSPGVRIVMQDDDAGGVTAEIHYVEGPGRRKKFRATVTGGTSSEGSSSLKFKLDHGGSQGILLARSDPSAKIKLLVNGRGMTDTAVSTPPPPPEVIVTDCAQDVLLSGGASATASSQPGAAGAVTDGRIDPGNWSAQAPPPQWVEIDLGAAKRVRFVSLNPEQTPSGFTQHRLSGLRPDGTQLLLGEYNGNTISGGVVTVRVDRNIGDGIRKVRVETVSSPSWVSWREVQVFGCE